MIYCILNNNHWNETLRQSLTQQLSNMNAITTFAALITPPGVSSSLHTMNEMIEVDTVIKNIDYLLIKNPPPKNEWLALSLTRLRSTLKGKDTI